MSRTITAIALDDQAMHLEELEIALMGLEGELKLIEKFENFDEAKIAVDQHKPDVVFLDIEMGSRTGFDFIDLFEEIHFEVIFTTAHDQYALRGFRANMVDYLVKPLDRAGVKSAIKKLQERLLFNNSTASLEILQERLRQSKEVLEDESKEPDSLILLVDSAYTRFSFDEIVRIEADSNYCNVYVTDSKKLLTARTLKSFDELLPEHSFVRVHQSHLVNMRYVTQFKSGKSAHLAISTGEVLPVAQSKKGVVKKALMMLGRTFR